jgi:hypothetical protein
MLPERTVNTAGSRFVPFAEVTVLVEACPLTVSENLPELQELPSCTTTFWYHNQLVPQDTTRRQFAPFKVIDDAPCELPKLLPYKVT